MTTFHNLILHLKLQGKRDEMVQLMREVVKDMTPGRPQTLAILDRLVYCLLTQDFNCESEESFREMLGKYIRTLGADDSSTIQVSKLLDTVAKWTKLLKRFKEFDSGSVRIIPIRSNSRE